MKTILALLFSMLSLASTAQTVQDLIVQNLQIVKSGGMAEVKFTAIIGSNVAEGNSKVSFTPVLHHGTEERNLTDIRVYTRNSLIMDVRKVGARAKHGYVYKNGEIVTYTFSLPFESWMEHASLRIDCRKEDCCKVINSKLFVPEKP